MRIFPLCILVLTLAAPAAFGQGKGKGKPKDNGQPQSAQSSAAASNVRFGTADAQIIADYYRPRVQQLPPGLEKKLQRGGTLPPGWQKKVQAFPRDLVGRLGPVPVGYSRVVSGRTALLINDATNVVLDILDLTR